MGLRLRFGLGLNEPNEAHVYLGYYEQAKACWGLG